MAESNFYSDVASKAARHEQDGEFSIAGQLWENASESALNVTNRKWARARADFCRYQQRLMQMKSWEEDAING